MDADLLSWCDEYLPDLYAVAMFDEEETADAVWEAVNRVATETILEYIEEVTEREELSDELHATAREWFRGHHETILEAIPVAPPTELVNRPQIKQHSAEWYSGRSSRLTASEFANILDGRRNGLLRAKLNPPPDRSAGQPVGIAQPDGEMVATTWGHRFEPLTRQIYELEMAGVGTVCDTLGRFTHPSVPWLSATPDGVVLSGALAGRLVEIKSPKTRQPGEFVPLDYYIQMQLQMEVCDVEAVDFIEAQFEQRPCVALTPEDEAAISLSAWKGRVQVYGHQDLPESWMYRYSSPVEDLEDTVFAGPAPSLPMLEDSVWWLTGWFPRTVLRNRDWWTETGWPAAQMFWASLLSLRSGASTSTNTISHVGDEPKEPKEPSGWIGSKY